MGTDNSSLVGTTVDAGLPNITGTISDASYGTHRAATGAFSMGASNSAQLQSASGSNIWTFYYPTVTMDASKSSSIYGGSTTVQPPALYVYIWRRVS